MAITATGTSTGVGISSIGPSAPIGLKVTDTGGGSRRISEHNMTPGGPGEGCLLVEYDLTNAQADALITALGGTP